MSVKWYLPVFWFSLIITDVELLCMNLLAICVFSLKKCLYKLLFSRQVTSNSLWPNGLPHTRLPCPSLSPRVCPSSCPLNRWCHPTISFSVALFSFCLQSYSASGSSPVSQPFASGSQNNRSSASASILPKSIWGWFPLRLTGLISLLSKGLSRDFSNTTVQKHQFFSTLLSLLSSSNIHTWLLERPKPWLCRPLWAKWCLCFLTDCLGLSFLSWKEAIIF